MTANKEFEELFKTKTLSLNIEKGKYKFFYKNSMKDDMPLVMIYFKSWKLFTGQSREQMQLSF